MRHARIAILLCTLSLLTLGLVMLWGIDAVAKRAGVLSSLTGLETHWIGIPALKRWAIVFRPDGLDMAGQESGMRSGRERQDRWRGEYFRVRQWNRIACRSRREKAQTPGIPEPPYVGSYSATRHAFCAAYAPPPNWMPNGFPMTLRCACTSDWLRPIWISNSI